MTNIKTLLLMAFLPLVILTTPYVTGRPLSEKNVTTHNNGDFQSGNEELSKIKMHISEIFKNKTDLTVLHGDGTGSLLGSPREIVVLDDRIEFRFKKENKIIYFSDILDYNITAVESNKTTDDGKSVIRFLSQITIGNIVLEIKGYRQAMELRNDLISIQYLLNEKRYSSQLVLFEPIAEQYRSLKVKPPVSEEQRKYIVQANSLNQLKEYDKAIELYNKAVELDQTAYPAAYTNLALLSAQVHKYNSAIYYMKKYLLLEPEASDARSARDKIYEWEILLKK